MITNQIKQSIPCILASAILYSVGTGTVFSHGLVENPPARNWFCGAVTKPDEVANGVAQYPQCGDAYANDFNGGYQFMSVLTHDRGRAEVRPLPDNVCGFDSETWQGGETPWDQSADWPTSPMSAGQQDFTWNISWGPHFSDTEEFRFWITNPDFQYDRDRKLAWNDFGNEAFCVQEYRDDQRSANPNVIPLVDAAQFTVSCSVPERSGRHVIYAEWGRNEYTLERFHGCIDVVFDGDVPPITTPVVVDAEAIFDISLDSVIGASSIELDGSASLGSNLEYMWTVNAADSSDYSVGDANAAITTLTFGNPSAAQEVTVTLTASNSAGQSTLSDSFMHESQTISPWVDLGPLVNIATFYSPGDTVSLRTVSDDGSDSFLPDPPLTLDDSNAGATQWPAALARAVGEARGEVNIGILNADNVVVAANDATANRIYASMGSGISNAFLVHTAIENPVNPEPPVIDPPMTPEPPPVIDPPITPEPPPVIDPPITPEPPTEEPPTLPPVSAACVATVRSGLNTWWAGLDIAFDANQATLDFSGTGLDLGAVRIDNGVFNVSVSGQTITLTKPQWVSANFPGYLGLNGNDVSALGNLSAPVCRT